MISLFFLIISIILPIFVGLPRGWEYAVQLAFGNLLIASSFLFTLGRAYRSCRLLEPSTFFMGMQYVTYGPANWWPITGVEMFISNPGSLAFYPTASILGGMGMWIYILTYNAIRIRYDPVRQMSSNSVSYLSLITLAFGCVLTYFSLSVALGQVQGFEKAGTGLTGPINWLALALHAITFAVTIAIPFYWNKDWSPLRKFLASFALVCTFAVIATFVSRTRLLLTTGVFCMVLIHRTLMSGRITDLNSRWKNMFAVSHVGKDKRKGSRAPGRSRQKVLRAASLTAVAMIALIATYFLGTYLRRTGVAEDKIAGVERLEAMANRPVDSEGLWDNAAIDMSYRMACLELPAAILCSQMQGTDSLWGEGFLIGLKGSLPNFLSTFLGFYKDKFQEKEEVEARMISHFGLPDVDQTGSVLASALADFGPFGIFILFPMLALFHGKFLLRIFLNRTTTIAYFGTLTYVLAFDHYIETQIFDLLKFLGFLILVLLPFTILNSGKGNRQRLRKSEIQEMPSC